LRSDVSLVLPVCLFFQTAEGRICLSPSSSPLMGLNYKDTLRSLRHVVHQLSSSSSPSSSSLLLQNTTDDDETDTNHDDESSLNSVMSHELLSFLEIMERLHTTDELSGKQVIELITDPVLHIAAPVAISVIVSCISVRRCSSWFCSCCCCSPPSFSNR
jgi:hypothetical protein